MFTKNFEELYFHKTEIEPFGKENTLLKREIDLGKRGGKLDNNEH